MRKPWSKLVIAIVLITLSIAFFLIQELVFYKPEEAGFLFFQDLAFLPLHVLFVTFILESFMREREKRERAEQINIVVSAFFSEVGLDAIKILHPFITNSEGAFDFTDIRQTWRDLDYKSAAKDAIAYSFKANSEASNLEPVKQLLYWKKDSILTMFENPNMLENNRFTSMLWALYHVMDELNNRDGYVGLPQTDYDHLSGDIERAYKLLVVEWIYYMRHLRNKYPYLFSLALRKSPFAENDSVIVY